MMTKCVVKDQKDIRVKLEICLLRLAQSQSRSNPDSKQRQKQGLYQSHSMCDHLWHLWQSQIVTISNLWSHALDFYLSFLVQQVWSHFGHKCHTWSHIQMWLVQTCFCFFFQTKWFGRNGVWQNIPESVFCICFLFGIRIRTALKLDRACRQAHCDKCLDYFYPVTVAGPSPKVVGLWQRSGTVSWIQSVQIAI